MIQTLRRVSIKFVFILLGIINVFTQPSYSSEESVEFLNSKGGYQIQTFSPWSIFGGIGGGYGLVSSQAYLNSPQGSQLLLNADLSYQAQRWLVDAGLGWYYSNVSGKVSATQSVNISTRAGLIELNPRYRISNHWQVGPVVNLAFGADTSFSPVQGQSSSSFLFGIKGVYELSFNAIPVRLWGQFSSDLSGVGQNMFLTWVGVQIGLPIKIFNRSTEVAKVEKSVVIEKIVASNQKLKFTLDPQRIFFNTSSTKINQETEVILAELGKYIEKNERPAEVEVLGHADQRGRFAYNLKLSRDRAEAVKKALVMGGMESARLDLQAYSFNRPLVAANTPQAWAKNRRVEIIFNHVKNPELLIEKLKPLTGENNVETIRN